MSLFSVVNFTIFLCGFISLVNANWLQNLFNKLEDEDEADNGDEAEKAVILTYEFADELKKVHKMSTSSLKIEKILLTTADGIISDHIAKEINNDDLHLLIFGSLQESKEYESDGKFLNNPLQKALQAILGNTIELFNVLDEIRGEKYVGVKDVKDIFIPMNSTETEINTTISEAIELVIK